MTGSSPEGAITVTLCFDPDFNFFFQPGDSGCLDPTPVGLLGQDVR